MSEQPLTTKISAGSYRVVFKGITWSVRRYKQRWFVSPLAGGQIRGQCNWDGLSKHEAIDWIRTRAY